MRQNPDRAKNTFVTTRSTTKVTGQSAPPRAGTRPTGSVKAMMTRVAASARMAVAQMTVQVRQICRNRGTRAARMP
jgi:predicted RNA-binding Zn ribbon-like protein